MNKKTIYLSTNNPTFYSICDNGQVFDEYRKIFLSVYQNPKTKRARVRFCNKYWDLANLVAENFLQDSKGFYTTVSHKNDDLFDNRAENLFWGRKIPPKEHRKIILGEQLSYYVIDKKGIIWNLNTGLKAKNYDKRKKNKTFSLSFNKKTYGLTIYKQYAESWGLSLEDSFKIIEGREEEIIPNPIIKPIEKARIVIEGEDTPYWIYKNGLIYNEETDKINTGYNDVYTRFKISTSKGSYFFHIHRLVAEYFIENPNNYEYVDHIDGDLTNNTVENLRWCTKTQNNQSFYKREREKEEKFLDTISDFSEEKWLPFYNYSVSDFGRVRNKNTGKILEGYLDKKGYHRYNLTVDSRLKCFLGHVLVYLVFKGEKRESNVINHIDGIKSNNFLSNLEEVSCSENILKGIYVTGKDRIVCFNLSGEEIGRYKTSIEASQKLQIPSGTIRSAMSQDKIVGNKYYFVKL